MNSQARDIGWINPSHGLGLGPVLSCCAAEYAAAKAEREVLAHAASNRVESIPTFAMAALAGIGAMPDTIEDRAVVIRMRRRAPNETVSPYRHRRDRPSLRQLAEQLTAWSRADLSALELAEPDMPVEDRAADTWEP